MKASGQHVLTLASGSGETLFNRPLGTPPESAPGTKSGTLTPPPPSEAGTPTASSSTPNSTATPKPNSTSASTPAKWTATGTWSAVITVNDQTYRVQVQLQDDSPRILGYGNDPVEYANGNSASGALDIGLDVDGRVMSLKTQGRFEGDRYSGSVRWSNYEGDDLGRGTITMTRR